MGLSLEFAVQRHLSGVADDDGDELPLGGQTNEIQSLFR